MKVLNKNTNITEKDSEFDNLHKFISDLTVLYNLHLNPYEYSGRLLFIAYRNCFFVESFNSDIGNIYFTFNNGEDGDNYRSLRLEISL